MKLTRLTRQAADDLCRYYFAILARDGSQRVDTELAALLATCRDGTLDTEDSSVPEVRTASCAGLRLQFRSTSEAVELIRVFGTSGPFPPIPRCSSEPDPLTPAS
jgi:hypothetical protein